VRESWPPSQVIPAYVRSATIMTAVESVKDPVSSTARILAELSPDDAFGVAALQARLLSAYYSVLYRRSELSFKGAFVATIVGLLFFMGAVGFMLIGNSEPAATVGAISAGLVEVIAGINFFLFRSTSTELNNLEKRMEKQYYILLASSLSAQLSVEAREKAVTSLISTISTMEQ
jgi:hypothetical protein